MYDHICPYMGIVGTSSHLYSIFFVLVQRGPDPPTNSLNQQIFFPWLPCKQKCQSQIPDRPPISCFGAGWPKWMCRPFQVVGLARAGGGGRAVRIGNDLPKIYFLLKLFVLDHFWSFLDLLDVRNGSGSKFQVYGWYREVCTTKISSFRGKSVIQPPTDPFAYLFLVRLLVCAKNM